MLLSIFLLVIGCLHTFCSFANWIVYLWVLFSNAGFEGFCMSKYTRLQLFISCCTVFRGNGHKVPILPCHINILPLEKLSIVSQLPGEAHSVKVIIYNCRQTFLFVCLVFVFENVSLYIALVVLQHTS